MSETVPAVRSAGLRILIVAALALLGWAAVRNAASALFAEDRPTLAMAFAPAGAAALANAAQARIVAAGGAADAQARTLTAAALQAAPRDAAPLILAGLAASADGANDRAQMLMEAARARDPRAGIARYWLLDHYVRTGQASAALAEVGPALRLRPGTRGAIFALVSAMAAAPESRGAVRAALAQAPDWRESFLTTQATANLDPPTLLRLLAALPPPPDPASGERERRAVLLAAVRAGAYREAYRLWWAALPADRRDDGPVHDPTFRHGFGDAPFGWTSPTAGMQAGPDGLAISPRGDASVVLAEQLVAAAGRQRLSVEGRGSGGAARLTCARDESPLGQASVGDTIKVTIPPACGAAWLRVVAVADETGTVPATTIAAVRLTPP